jgi:hypothetical protein
MIDCSERPALSEVLREIGEDQTRSRVSFGDLLTAMGDRALGALLFLFASPNILPSPPGASTVLGTPLIFLAAQLTFGCRPWLPGFITQRSMSHEDYRALIKRVGPWLEKAEKLLRPRLSCLATPPMEYLVGFICFVLSVILALPIPMGNNLPGLAISLMALGILEKDGIWVMAGLTTSVVAIAVVSGVLLAMLKTGIYLVQQLFQFLI